MKRPRRNHSAAFKAKVAVAALKGVHGGLPMMSEVYEDVFRWLNGQLKGGSPYPDACRVLEVMLPPWSADDLFGPPPVNGIAFTRQGRCQEREEVLGTTKPPYTLALTASLLRDAGCDVRLIDATAERVSIDEVMAGDAEQPGAKRAFLGLILECRHAPGHRLGRRAGALRPFD